MERRLPGDTRRRAWLRGAVCATLATLLLACAACPFAPEAPSDAALGELTPWRDVFADVARRADLGDPASARIALEMHRLGPQLYGGGFDATPAQLQAWHCRALTRELPCAAAPPA